MDRFITRKRESEKCNNDNIASIVVLKTPFRERDHANTM